jgi:hypothetical protein
MVAAANHRDFYLSSVIEIKHLFFGVPSSLKVSRPYLCLHGYKAEAWLQHSKVGFVGQVSIPADGMVFPKTRRIGISALQLIRQPPLW